MLQDSIFFNSEGNNWYNRNSTALDAADKIDWPCHLIQQLDGKENIKSVIELGCSSGYRLAKLRSKLAPDCGFAGVDASIEAVTEGMRKYQGLDLRHAALSDIPFQKEFDVVIVNFVLHWIDRRTLALSIAEADRLLKNGGYLVLGDFLPDFPQRRRYHHLSDENVYTFKQDYSKIFLALGTYQELARVSFNHDSTADYSFRSCASSERGFTTLLHKSLDSFYPEQ